MKKYCRLTLAFNWLPGFPLCVVLFLFAPFAQSQDDTWIDLEKRDGAALFGEKCGMCHRQGGMGTGILGRRLQGEQALLENRTDLQPQFIETVVRAGFGVMFPISRGEVSDEQLDKITQHLVKQEARP